jgi:ATP-dependent DNA helicase DinG
VQKELKEIFANSGPLSQHLSYYEQRLEQVEMALQIAEAYTDEHIALIEAGTGIGKSLAYLIPAILWAVQKGERTVIATNTIALQEQLIEKDIPFLLNMLDVELKASLVKGMSNYACLERYTELEEEHPKLSHWIVNTSEGSRSDLNFPLPPGLWEKIAVEPDRCTGPKCPHYKACYFFKARRSIHDSKLLVVNHHLLLADLTAEKDQAILPDFERLVLDEAHNFEEIALESLSGSVDRAYLVRLLSQKIDLPANLPSHLQVRLEIDIPGEKHSLFVKVDEAFRRLPDQSYRVKEPFSKEILEGFEDLEEDLAKFIASAKGLISQLEKFSQMDHYALELHVLVKKLTEITETIGIFFDEKNRDSRLRWIEKTPTNWILKEADLDVSSYLKKLIFDRFVTTILCSATLTTNRAFSFMRTRLGIKGPNLKVTERIYDSPFDYQNRVKLAIPKDFPDPTNFHFLNAAIKMIEQAIKASQGGAFVLFTSYDMLNQCYELLRTEFTILRQGDASRTVLLDAFKAKKNSILFGTDSFWEGVDVPGEALRLVIIVKLPFKVPDDPIVAAKSDLLRQRGKNPFMEYLLPEAIIKFKQGFGRLMRRKGDYGFIICLDNRLMTKTYGNLVLKSLPPCPVVWEDSKLILKRMQEFYSQKK